MQEEGAEINSQTSYNWIYAKEWVKQASKRVTTQRHQERKYVGVGNRTSQRVIARYLFAFPRQANQPHLSFNVLLKRENINIRNVSLSLPFLVYSLLLSVLGHQRARSSLRIDRFIELKFIYSRKSQIFKLYHSLTAKKWCDNRIRPAIQIVFLIKAQDKW